ncbi:MAG TPA: V-type ATP synthase subunit F [Gammaproteobacteria bacterium]|nr:V-type ATP synthase subunit F [Gammaproteobacteria bacterium]
MPAPVFIGDELSATGYRLGGARVHSPPLEDAPDVFRRAQRETDLILVSVEYARALPQEELNRSLLQERPLVLVVPDVRERFQMRDVPSRLRRELGVSE